MTLQVSQSQVRRIISIIVLVGLVMLAYFRFAHAQQLAACVLNCFVERFEQQTGMVHVGYDLETSVSWASTVLDAHLELSVAIIVIAFALVLVAHATLGSVLALQPARHVGGGISPPWSMQLRRGIRGGRLATA